MTVWVKDTMFPFRWYSAKPATCSSRSTSNRPTSGLSTTLGALSVIASFPWAGSWSPAGCTVLRACPSDSYEQRVGPAPVGEQGPHRVVGLQR
jgi:hypothetical protein